MEIPHLPLSGNTEQEKKSKQLLRISPAFHTPSADSRRRLHTNKPRREHGAFLSFLFCYVFF